MRLARLTVAGLASRMGFNFDEVEDLRIAVDEQCHWLMGPKGHLGTVTLLVAVHPGALAIEGRVEVAADGNGQPPSLSAFSRQILDAVVDTYECDKNAPQPWFRVEKRRSS